MHKHFYVPGYDHLGINAQLAWKFNDPKSQKFSQMLSRLRKPYNGLQQLDTADMENFASELAREVVFGQDGVQARLSGRGTGDWIVYLTHEGQNYYLCIAKHGEDEFILETIKLCCVDFPSISALLKDGGKE